MTERDSSSAGLPDDVPEADAVEQSRPAADPLTDSDRDSSAAPPLEASVSDWHEQHLVVDVDDEEFR